MLRVAWGMNNLRCCVCGNHAERIMEGFTLCKSPDCYVKAHLPGYALTVSIYALMIAGAVILKMVGAA